MVDQIALDPAALRQRAEALRAAGQGIADFTQAIFSALAPHDPSNGGGDETGKSIGTQYFPAANQLLHAAAVAGALLIDMADLTIDAAQHGADTEVALAKLNEDLSSYDPKLGLSPDPWQSPTPGESGSPGTGRRG